MPKTEPKVQVAARLPKTVVRKVDSIAERLRVDRSTVIRWVLEEMSEKFVPSQIKR